MASSMRRRAILAGGGLAIAGGTAALAAGSGLWGLLTGAALAAVWLLTVLWRAVAPPPPPPSRASNTPEAAAQRLLLDAAPIPMLGLDGGAARALNRAARTLFATDDRVLPPPADLVDEEARYVTHEGRRWRADRVVLDQRRSLVALVDIEREERDAEARSAAELVEILGHELLNGLAPIASLAESGLSAIDGAAADPALLRDILQTLARRADGLQRFAERYRRLARLPDPVCRPVALTDVTGDLARLFAGRWPSIPLTVEIDAVTEWAIDRDQFTQALWAILQNAAEAAASTRGEAAMVTLALAVVRGALVVEVRDNGSAIPSDQAVRIFRPFYTTKPNGTGIGLGIARQIAQAHGGSLRLEPAPQTVFRLVLPEGERPPGDRYPERPDRDPFQS